MLIVTNTVELLKELRQALNRAAGQLNTSDTKENKVFHQGQAFGLKEAIRIAQALRSHELSRE